MVRPVRTAPLRPFPDIPEPTGCRAIPLVRPLGEERSLERLGRSSLFPCAGSHYIYLDLVLSKLGLPQATCHPLLEAVLLVELLLCDTVKELLMLTRTG